MATKLTPAQLAGLDFLIAVGQQPRPTPQTPTTTTPPVAEATTAAPAAAEKLVSRGGLGGTLGGPKSAGFLDDVVDFVEDAWGDLQDDFDWADAVSAIEDVTEHLAEALNGLPIPLLEELGVQDAKGGVVAREQMAAMRKRPLSVDDLIALRDAQRKL